MPNVFTQTFSGSAVSPSEVAFASYTFASNLTLYWPQFSAGQTNVAARFMNLTATNNSLNVFMPDATLVSVGYDVIIFNAGADTFNVVDFNGGAIATIATGQTYYIILNDNTTQSGGWQTVQFGVGTGSASAAALAGAGLLAAAGMLNVNFDAVIVTNNYAITSANRAILQVWTGGTGTITLPSAASVGDGFFFPLANNGSGNVTLATSGGDQIDEASTSVFSQSQSGFVISSGSAWYTVGKGIQNTFAVTLLNLNVAGSSDIVETSAQAQNIIQQYTGILTGNINVIVPNTVQLYYVFNNTSGAFTLTVKTASGTGILVNQGSHSILYCDGTNVLNAFTSSFGGAITIAPGSANAPNLNFIGSTSTGIYSPSANQFAITAGGYEVMNFTSAASSVNYLQSSATATGTALSISALGGDANISIALMPKGTGTVTTSTSFTGNLVGNVTGNVSGTAPAGTLTGTTLASNVVTSSLTKVGALASGSLVAGFTPVTVPLGGTGLATLTANNVILGNGTSTPAFVAPGTSGNLLTSNGSTWQSTAAPNNNKVTLYQVSDSTDISLSQAPTQANLGSPISATIPTKGIIRLSWEGAYTGSSTTHLVIGIRIGGTNYWPIYNDSGGGTNYMTVSQNTNGSGNSVSHSEGFGGSVDAMIGGQVGLSIEGLSIPTGSQTIQFIVASASGVLGTVKGTSVTSKGYISLYDYT